MATHDNYFKFQMTNLALFDKTYMKSQSACCFVCSLSKYFAACRPTMRYMIEYYSMNGVLIMISKTISTVFFIGYIPFAPGTCGSLVALMFIWLLQPSLMWQAGILAGVFVIGVITSGITEKAIGQKDCQHIVIDEFAGYLCSIIFLPLTPFYMISAFVLFRIFDILKPPPICYFEKLSGGAGIMLDDVAAGVVSNILLQIVVVFIPG
jgi:phosphatidylglycerophosphatase A